MLTPREQDYIESQTLQEIDQFLKTMGQSLARAGISYDIIKSVEKRSCLPSWHESLDNVENFDTVGVLKRNKQHITSLNNKQAQVFDLVVRAMEGNGENKWVYCDGPEGSGKTYLHNTIIDYAKCQMHSTVMVGATTGMASTLLEGGRTVHSMFRLSLNTFEDSVSNLKNTDLEWELLYRCKAIIIDEASFLSKTILAIMDRTLQGIMKSSRPFGNKVLLLGGDFRQTLPITLTNNKADVINNSIKGSYLWRSFQVHTLTQNMRCLESE